MCIQAITNSKMWKEDKPNNINKPSQSNKKSTLFIDFDSTIVDTVSAICQFYSIVHSKEKGYVTPVPANVNRWNCEDECPLFREGEIEKVFDQNLFFNLLSLFPHAIEVLKKLNDKYEVIIVSIGSYDNISLKSQYIKEKLPFIDNFIGIVNNGCKMNKSCINMSNDDNECDDKGKKALNYFIDDNAGNLFSVRQNGVIRYCFGEKKEWNKEWIDIGGRRLVNWLEIEKELL